MIDWLEYHHEPVQLHSGDWSHWLVRGDIAFQDEHVREAVLDYWVKVLAAWDEPFNIIGIPTGGTPWADALRERVATDEKTWFRVAVDDVVTTGASLRGVNATLWLVFFDRRLKRTGAPVNAWDTIPLPLEALSDD